MASRNMKAIIEQTEHNIPGAYRLTSKEYFDLTEPTFTGEKNANARAIVNAFVYGFALGRRAEKNARKKPLPKR